MALPAVPATNIGMSDLAKACGVSNTLPGGDVAVETFVNLSLNGLRSGTGGNLLATKTDSTANLAQGVNTSETAIDVTDGSQFTAQQYIQVNNEIMRVTGVSSNTLTVLREESSVDNFPADTVGDSHTNDDDVYHANPFVPYAFPDDLGTSGTQYTIVQGYLTSWLDAVDGGGGYGNNTSDIGMKLTFYTNAGSGRAADVAGYVGR
tara:strand:+ start:123 stop:740 length:618 start_codon:yes stop_codon:yes gene_type:complete